MRNGLLLLLPVGIVTAMIACGTSERRSGFGAVAGDGGSGEAGNTGFTPNAPCADLECQIATDCSDGAKTSLTGKVFDPAGANPLYNIQVYVPKSKDAPLPPLADSTKDPDGIKCETCAGQVVNPLRSTLTDGTGAFVLDDVPVDKELPVVIQVGKWRKVTKVDTSQKCTENKVKDRTLKLPQNGDEGDMPQIAVTSGDYDALECLLRGIGIDDSEFIEGHGDGGHVHLFKGYGGGMGTPAQDFWTDATQLKKYDILLLSCEGDEHNENKGDHSAVYDYLNAGGRAFATHYHYTWFKNSPADEFKNIAQWGSNLSFTTQFEVNQDFPKGKQFAEWLAATGASTGLGKITLEGATDSVKAVNDPATPWITVPDNKPEAKYFSFNTPLSSPVDQQCGRAVFSDVHIIDKSGGDSPSSISACPVSAGGLNAQQKALEFLFFDLSSCVTSDQVDPTPPK